MKYRASLLPVLFALCSFVGLQAQDIHFSQFYLSPLNLNPAMTGVMDCNIRLTANYRNQWAAVLKSYAFSTYSVSYDQRIPVGRYDYFGVGGTFWGDKAGEAQFGTTTGKLSLSYAKRMGGGRREAHYLVVGAEGGIAQRSVDFIKLKWPSQYDGQGGYDPTLPTFEDNFEPNFIFADMAAGLLWFSVWDRNSFYMGAAFHHLNRANQSFYQGQVEDLYSRFTFHVGGEFELSPKFGMVPGAIVMMQGPSMQVNGGTSFRFVLNRSRNDYQAFQVGTWVRIANKLDEGILGDAFILSTRFDYNQFTLGFSYDVNMSDLRQASNGNGSFEFAMQYRFCGPEKRGVYCPKF